MGEIRGTAVGGDARLQSRVSAAEIAGKELGIEVNAPERSDFRLMLHEPTDPVEKGLIKRFVRDEVWNNIDEEGNSVWIKKFEAEFDDKKQSIFKTLITQRDLTEWKEGTRNHIQLLRELLEVIKAGDTEALMNMRGNISLQSSGRRGDIGYEASRQLAEVFKRVSAGMGLSEASKRAAQDSIETLIKQEIGVEEVFASVNPVTRWEDLSPEAQAHVFRFYMNLRWGAEMGTIERQAELEVLRRRRGPNGKRAPWKVFEGAERQVYEAILDWRTLDNQLKAETDPEKRQAIQDRMKDHEQFISEWTSDLTATFDNRVENTAIGVNQVKQGAWGEIRHTFDKLREGDKAQTDKGIGKVKKTFVYTGATFDAGSWESVGLKGEIFLQFGTAKNALKRLEQVEALDPAAKTRWIEENFVLEKQVVNDASKEYVEDLKKRLKEAVNEQDRVRYDLGQAKNNLSEAQATLQAAQLEKQQADMAADALRNAGYGPGQAGSPRRQGGGGQQDELAAALSRKTGADAALRLAEAAQTTAQTKLNEIVGYGTGSGAVAGQMKDINKLVDDYREAIDAGGSLDMEADINRNRTEKKLERYNKLLENLRKYVVQNTLDKDFYDLFNNDDVEIIGKITAVGSSLNTKTDKRTLTPSLVATGDVEENGEVKFVGDYAFINTWALPEQVGRVSPDILQQMFDKPEAYPEIEDLIKRLKLNNKIIIVTSFAVQNDVDGGMIEKKLTGSGRAFDTEAAENLKKANKWTDYELFAHWLDDLNIQRELGVRPEEVVARYSRWLAKNHLLRQTHFKAEDDWTFINTSVSTSTPNFFEIMIRRMVDAGLPVTSQAARRAPFFQQLGKAHEYTYVITDDKLQRRVLFRGEELSLNKESPKTIVDFVYKSLMNELELYYNRTKIGAQTTSQADWMTADDVMKLGAYVDANCRLIQKKMMILRTIYGEIKQPLRLVNGQQVGPSTPEAVLQKMIDWSEGRTHIEMQKIGPDGRPMVDEIGQPVMTYDDGMINLTFDILDENGEFIEDSANVELWQEYNATHQWLGKLKRNQREAEIRYAQTDTNPNATEMDIEAAEADYLYALSERRNFEVRQYGLGMQAAGRMEGKTTKEVGQVISNKYAQITGDGIRRINEQQMRAIGEYDRGRMFYHPQNIARRLVGRIAKSRIGEFCRVLGNTVGIGDRFLGEEAQQKITDDIRNKADTEIFRRVAAHSALSIETGYQNTWGGVWHPESSDVLLKEEDMLDIHGQPILDNIDAPSAQLSRTGEAYLKAIEKRVRDDIGDAVDRDIGNNMHKMIKAGKDRGWDIDEIMKIFLESKMNDTAEVEFRNGQWQVDPFGKLDLDQPYDATTGAPRHTATRISLLERMFLREVRSRMRHSGWTYGIYGTAPTHRSPDDTRAVHPRWNNPPVIVQKAAADARNAGYTGPGDPNTHDPRLQ